MSNHFAEFNNRTNKETSSNLFSFTIHRSEYTTTHAYPDEISAKADPEDNNATIDSVTNDFDM